MASGEYFLSDYSRFLIDKVEKDPVYNGVRRILRNGIVVNFVKCKGDPIAYFLLHISSGSFHEPIGRKGLVHLYEHLAFSCRKNLKDSNFYEKVKDQNIQINGGTNYDSITFTAVLTSNNLEKYLKAESERYASVGPMVTDRDISNEIAIIRNEYFNSLLDNPLAKIEEAITLSLFNPDHPLYYDVIGKWDDLKSVTKEDIIRFENEYITPEKTRIYIHGDYDEEYVFELADRYFGQKGTFKKELKDEIDVKQNFKTFNQPSAPGCFYFKNDQYAKGVVICYNGAGKYTKEWIGICMVLGLMKLRGIITRSREISTLNYGYFYIPIYEESIAEGYNNFFKSLNELDCNSVTDKQLEEAKQQMLMIISGEESILNKLKIAANLEISTGESSWKSLIGNIKEATKVHLKRTLETYFLNNHHISLSLIRPGEEEYVIPGSKEIIIEKTWISPDFEHNEDNPVFKISTGETPEILKKTTPIWRFQLKNGVKVYGSTMKSRGKIEGEIFINADICNEPPGKSGINLFCAKILECSKKYSFTKYNETLIKLNSTVKIETAPNGIEIKFKTDREHLNQLFHLFKESFLSPRINNKSVAEIKNRINQELILKKESSNSKSFDLFTKLAFGKNHPYTRSSYGFSSHRDNINTSSLRKYFDNYIIPNLTKIYISGDIRKEDLKRIFLPLETQWKRKRVKRVKQIEVISAKCEKIYLIDSKDEDGVWISAYRFTPTTSVKDNYIFLQMNSFLGFYEGINLLDQNLRYKKSLSYVASSGIYKYGLKKYFYARCSTNISKFSESFPIFTDTIFNYANYFTPEMFTYTRNEIITSRRAMANQIDRQLNILKVSAHYPSRRHPDKERLRALLGLTQEQIVKAARNLLRPSELYIIIIGDKSRLIPQLQQLNYTDIE